jgi:hypothetical protein
MSDAEAAPRAGGYPFTEWQKGLMEAVPKLKGRPKYCAINAFRGLKRAWSVAELDPEIAYFRALTAEEEAATALIIALKHRRYPGAEKLDHTHHPHKMGLAPFLGAIETVFAEGRMPSPSYKLDYESTPPRLDVRIASENLGLPPGYSAQSDEPLDGVFQVDGDPRPSANVFDDALERYAKIKGAKSVLRAIQDEANIRNRLLYAADNGITKVENVDSVLLAKGRPITLMLTLTVAVLQTRRQQLLPAQALEAYLRIFDREPDTPFDFAGAIGPLPDTRIEVTRDEDGKASAVLHRAFSFKIDISGRATETDE